MDSNWHRFPAHHSEHRGDRHRCRSGSSITWNLGWHLGESTSHYRRACAKCNNTHIYNVTIKIENQKLYYRHFSLYNVLYILSQFHGLTWFIMVSQLIMTGAFGVAAGRTKKLCPVSSSESAVSE